MEAREASGHIRGIHDGKMYVGEFGKLSLLVVVNVVSDGLVNSFVCPFAATISFGVVGHGHLQFDAGELVEGCPKFSGEEWVLIGNKVQHQPVFAIPFVEEHDGDFGGSVSGVGSSDADVGPKRVCHGQDSVFPVDGHLRSPRGKHTKTT